MTRPSAAGPKGDAVIRKTIADLVAARGPGKSICPSEAARALGGPDEKVWGRLMKPVRAVAVAMARAGDIEIRRKGRVVDPDGFRGLYRLALPSGALPTLTEVRADVAGPDGEDDAP